MSDKTGIEWTDATWNPVTGCTKVSPGCAHCYAEAITLRFKRGGSFLPGKTTVRVHPERSEQPAQWRTRRMIFVKSMRTFSMKKCRLASLRMCSMSWRLAHGTSTRCSLSVLSECWNMRSYRMGQGRWPSHVWAGVSVENQVWADRMVPILC